MRRGGIHFPKGSGSKIHRPDINQNRFRFAMPYRFTALALVWIAALSGCCHPCCAPRRQAACIPACPPDCSTGDCASGHCHGGVKGRIHGALHHHWNYWKQPPRAAEITPPVARFHSVPARPVFEIPPAPAYGPTPADAPHYAPVPQPMPGP